MKRILSAQERNAILVAKSQAIVRAQAQVHRPMPAPVVKPEPVAEPEPVAKAPVQRRFVMK